MAGRFSKKPRKKISSTRYQTPKTFLKGRSKLKGNSSRETRQGVVEGLGLKKGKEVIFAGVQRKILGIYQDFTLHLEGIDDSPVSPTGVQLPEKK